MFESSSLSCINTHTTYSCSFLSVPPVTECVGYFAALQTHISYPLTSNKPVLDTQWTCASVHVNDASTPPAANADTGSTGHYMAISDAQWLTNMQPTSRGIEVNLPDGSTIKSTHTASLDLPSLPAAAQVAHVFPGLTGSLLSIGVLCDFGCTAVYDATSVTIYRDSQVVLTGVRSPDTHNLWMVPLDSTAPTQHLTASAASLAPRTQAQIVAFYHACLSSPSVVTFLEAVERGYLRLPGLTASMIRKHPPHSIATSKGHLDQKRQGLRSTKRTAPRDEAEETTEDRHPSSMPMTNKPDRRFDIFLRVAPVEAPTGRHDIDATGRYPVTSKTGNQYVLVFFCVDENYIHTEPLARREAADYLKAYKAGTEFFRTKGITITFVMLDNETSKQLERFCSSQSPAIAVQYVPPGNHRANKAERAIRTWKNHFISTLATTDPSFPLTAWDELLGHAELTLNLLRSSGRTPRISAYHQVCGEFVFDRTPIAPPGMLIVTHDKPTNRGSFAPHGTEGYYVGPALQHYRCYRVITKRTQSSRITDTVTWHPPPALTLPGASPYDDLIGLFAQVQTAISVLSTSDRVPMDKRQPLKAATPAFVTALRTLAEVFTGPAADEEIDDEDATLAIPPPAVTPVIPPPAVTPVIPPPAVTPVFPPLAVTPVIPPPAVNPVIPPPAVNPLDATHTSTTAPTADHRLTISDLLTEPTKSKPGRKQRVLEDTLQEDTSSTLDTTALKQPVQTAEPTTATVGTRRSSRQRLPSQWLASQATIQYYFACTAKDLDYSGTLLTYSNAIKGPEKANWLNAHSEEFIRLIDESGTMKFIAASAVPSDRRPARYNPQTKKKFKNGATVYRVRGTYDGSMSDYTGDKTAWVADLTTIKLFLNAAVSEDAEVICADIKDFYLGTTLERKEYMKIHRRQIPDDIQQRYNLAQLWQGDYVYVEISKGIYGLPQAGKLAQDRLVGHLAKHGYEPTTNSPCLFKHTTRPIMFTLVADDFCIKFTEGREHAEHLITALQELYIMTVDWTGTKYVGMTIKFDRANRTVTISMPDYVANALTRFGIVKTGHGTDSPLLYTKPVYGSKVQQLSTEDSSPYLSAPDTKFIQEVVGVFLYYARCVDPTMLTAVNKIGSKQARPTTAVLADAHRLLQYAATWPNAEIVYHASDMVYAVHTDASYLSETYSRSRAGGVHMLTDASPPDQLKVNGPVECISTIIPTVVSSAFEAEYAAMFINGNTAAGIHWLI